MKNYFVLLLLFSLFFTFPLQSSLAQVTTRASTPARLENTGFEKNFQANFYMCFDVFDEFGSTCGEFKLALLEFRWFPRSEPLSNGLSNFKFGVPLFSTSPNSSVSGPDTKKGKVGVGAGVFSDEKNSVPLPNLSVEPLLSLNTANKSNNAADSSDFYTNGTRAFTFDVHLLLPPPPIPYLEKYLSMGALVGVGAANIKTAADQNVETIYRSIKSKNGIPTLSYGLSISLTVPQTNGRVDFNLQYRAHMLFPKGIDYITVSPVENVISDLPTDYEVSRVVFHNLFFGVGFTL